MKSPVEENRQEFTRPPETKSSESEWSFDRPAPRTPTALQRQSEPGNGSATMGAEGGPISDGLAERIDARRGGGGPLDPSTREHMEGAFGASFSDVRVHADGEASDLNRQVGAVAFTTGSDIFFREGMYQPTTDSGRGLVAHELTHVVQQRSLPGEGPIAVGPASDSSEREAEASSDALTMPADRERSEGGLRVSAIPAGRQVARLIQRAISPVELRLERTAAGPDPRLQHTLSQVHAVAHSARGHPPTAHMVSVAQKAASTPGNDQLSRAQATQVKSMNAAPASKPEPDAFLALIRQKLAEIAPKNNQEMKEFGKSGKAAQMGSAVKGDVDAEKNKSADPVNKATNAAPPTDQIAPRDQGAPPQAPGATAMPAVDATGAVPAPPPNPAPPIVAAAQSADQQMADNKITEEQLQKANDPRFSAASDARQQMHASAAVAAQQAPGQQHAIVAQATADAHAKTAAAHAQMQQHHADAHGHAHAQQQAVMDREAQARKNVADTIEHMFNDTKARVQAKLNELGPAVDQLWSQGEKAARDGFDAEVDRRTDEYWLDHPLDALAGWATGSDPELEKIWHGERDNYMRALDNVLVAIADRVEKVLKEAKEIIAHGHDEIDKYVAGLDPHLRESGKQAEEAIDKKFEELQKSVDAKREELAQQLVDKYQAAQQAIDDHIKELEAANQGLIDGFIGKLEEVAKAIEEFRARLTGVVTDAEETLDLIIQDPIAFLGHLLDALKLGFTNFLGNILTHLKKGLMEWLFGAIASMGITLPETFDLKGIVMLVLQVLGITWQRIRAKIVKIIGPRAMAIIEKIVSYVADLLEGGVEKLWEHIKQDIGGLKDMVISAVEDWVITTVIKIAIQKLITLSNPVGAIIEAVIDIYKVVMFFIEKAQQIMTLVESIVKSVSAIAHGVIDQAASWVETSMANTIPVIIGFLADLIGLGGITEKIQETIKKLQDYVDKIIDAALEKIVSVAKGLFGGEKESAEGPDERTDEQKKADLSQALGESDKLFTRDDASPDLIRQELGPIKTKYRLTDLQLVVDKQGTGAEDQMLVHVEGSMSPPVAGPAHTITAKPAELVEAQCNIGLKDGALDIKDKLTDISREDLTALQEEFGVGTQANLTNVRLQGQILEYEVDVILGDAVEREGAEETFPLGSRVGLLEPTRDQEGRTSNLPWQRAHVIGPGFGIELPMILYAPHKVNQDLQNRGIEKLLRELTTRVGDFGDIHVTATARSQAGSLRLGDITYRVSGQKEGQPMKDLLEVTITVEGTVSKPRVSSRRDFISTELEGFLGMTWESFAASQDPDVERAIRTENRRMRSVIAEEARRQGWRRRRR